MLTPERLTALRANMFPAAHSAIDDWDAFPWHFGATQPHSSQMLAIDVFGSIKTAPARDAILGAVARKAGVPDSGPWSLHIEWQDSANTLREYTPTQIDAAAISDDAILLFECKFTEGGGGCSHIKPSKGVTPCNGSYAPQINPQNDVSARCALSGKGIRYWDFIPDVYGLAADADHAPCPFAFDAYQWMRNVVMARALAESTGKQARAFAVYADAPFLQTMAKVRSGTLGLPTTRATDAIAPLSYDALIALAADAAPDARWAELAAWVDAKIARAKR